jgi:hypothetical protein
MWYNVPMAMAENKSKHKFNPPTGDVIESILKSGDRLVNEGKINKEFIQEVYRIDSSTTITVSKLQKPPTFLERIKSGPPLQLEVQIEEELDDLKLKTEYLVFKRTKRKFDLKMRTYFEDETIIPDNNAPVIKPK